MSLLDRALEYLNEQRHYEWNERIRDPPPADKFVPIIRRIFPNKLGNGANVCFGGKAFLKLDQRWSDNEHSKYSILIRNVYVCKQHRNKGYFKQIIHHLVEASEETGTILVLISNPFEVEEFGDEKEKDALAVSRFTKVEYPQFLEHQKKMADLLLSFGFQTWEYGIHNVGDTTNVDPENCFIYKPKKMNTKFFEKYMVPTKEK